jgi:protein SCO1/2
MKSLLYILISFAATLAILANESPLTMPAGQANEGSIYELESNWRTQKNDAITLSDLGGKVRVVAMGYTSCQYACPRIIADLKRIERELTDKELESENLGFSFISIDPENDTPKRMKQLEEDYGFEPNRWALLTGDEDGVLELAVALGMKYRKTSAMDFAHSNIITILAPDGKIAYQTSEIGEDITKTLLSIRKCLSSIEDE